MIPAELVGIPCSKNAGFKIDWCQGPCDFARACSAVFDCALVMMRARILNENLEF